MHAYSKITSSLAVVWCPTRQHQRTIPVTVGQAASRIVLTSSKHCFPAAGGLNAASVAELILLCWCISTTFSICWRNLLCPDAHSCLFFLSAQNRFYLSGFPRANASFLQEYTVLISANQMFFPPTFLKKFVCLTCFLHVQYARILNHTRQMWKLQVWTAGLFWGFFQSSFQGNFQDFFVVQTVVLDVQTFQDRLRKSLFSLWGEYVLNIFY